MSSRIHEVGVVPVAGAELTITTPKRDRTMYFAGAFITRSLAGALTITISLITDWGTFPYMQAVGVTALSWGSTLVSDRAFPIAANMQIKIETSGIGGGETSAGVILLEEPF
jgi:hypothetical protein